MHLAWKRVCRHSKVQHSSVCLIVVKNHSCGELKMRRTQADAGIAVYNPALSYWTPCRIPLFNHVETESVGKRVCGPVR